MLTTVELTVLRALAPGAQTAEALRLTTPYGVAALAELLEGLARAGYVEAVGPRAAGAVQTEWGLTDDGAAATAATPETGRFPEARG